MGLFGGGDDLASVADDIFGKSELPDVGRVVARPTPILSIWADVKQPRRAIPLSIRMHWDGNPLDVAALLEQWATVAANQAGVTIDLEALLNGEGEGIDTDKFPSVAQDFIALVRLAAGIKADGLINPITVIESDSKLLIESGERRWLAYHLLYMVMGETFTKIPAAKGNGNDSVWRQATENTQRRSLNAIGMARQIALLIMAARTVPTPNPSPLHGEGNGYKEYDEVIGAGVCDRRFYAQVADGNIHRIPKGMGERIQAAMGLSMEQLSRYRSLLEMTDDNQVNDILWTRADIENWAEHSTREVYTLPTGKVRAVIEREQWTLDDLKALKTPTLPSPMATGEIIPRRPVTSEWMNKTVITKGGQIGRVFGVDGDWIKVTLPNSQSKNYHYSELTISGDKPGAPAIVPTPSPSPLHGEGNNTTFGIGDRVRTRTGTEGEVVAVAGRMIGVKTASGVQTHYPDLLTKIVDEVKATGPWPVDSQVVTKYGRVLFVRGYIRGGTQALVNSAAGENPWSVMVGDLSAYVEPVIDEAAIEEDVEPDAPPPTPEWREGYGVGSGDEVGADKAPSPGQPATKVLTSYGHERTFLIQLRSVANVVNDDATEMMMQRLLDTTHEEINAMSTEELQTHLNFAFGLMQESMNTWLNKHFVDVLTLIQNSQ
jgi:preprotein translocase subunit YajC